MAVMHAWRRWWRATQTLLCAAAATAGLAAPAGAGPPLLPTAFASPGGILYACPDHDLTALQAQLRALLQGLGIPPQLYQTLQTPDSGQLLLQLQGLPGDTDTLRLMERRELNLREELVQLPGPAKSVRTVLTVSRKEIALALLQRGRTTRFSGAACNPQALLDHIGIRQNIVAWIETVEWNWPDGGPARWNSRYWRSGNLKKGVPLHTAVADFFLQPRHYALGCYAATKLVVMQGVLDYYLRVRKDPAMLALVEARLGADGEHLSFIEPGAMWYFEADASPQDLARAGKLLRLQNDVPHNSFIPGDWAYLLNTDPRSSQKIGYEGSNAVYLGRGKFDDYYNDNNHSYTYSDKLQEVYQWRNGVFSRSRDLARTTPLSAAEVDLLSERPEQGGLQLGYRAVPYLFGFEALDVP